jgi:hypothetical protein
VSRRRFLDRRVLAVLAGVVVVAIAYLWIFAATEVTPTVRVAYPTAVIGAGDEAVGVTPDGQLLVGRPPPEEGTLPSLPTPEEPPPDGRLTGTLREQAIVLGAAPAALRPCVAFSRYGETGVEVELRSGIELRFGDATRAEEKWHSAIALLADPSITALDYVNVVSPARPSTEGSSHPLPAPGEPAAGGCGA